ncbi:MAG: GIY-YIG nuclease family protein [Bacteroidota bacterium]
MYKVYAIASINRKYIYVRITSNLDNRLERHNRGYEKTTKPYSPFILIYEEDALDRPVARLREKYLKSRIGKRFLCLSGVADL